jgi:flagellar motor switch protein FliG
MAITGPKKAAILLLSLGEDIASDVLRNLEGEEIQKITNYMSRLKNVPPEDMRNVLDEFYDRTSSGTISLQGGENYIKRVISKALGERRAEEIIKEMGSGSKIDKSSFQQSVRNLDPKTLAVLISNEHPQVISVILAHLPPERAAQVLTLLPENLKLEVILRFSSTESITAEVLEVIDEILQKKMESLGTKVSQQLGGIQKVADMLNQMDKSIQETLLDQVGEKEPILADEIRQLMFSFEDLVLLDNRGIQTLLKEISNQELAMGLKAASETIKDLFFKNMSERATNMIKEDMEVLGPVRLRDVESAQKNIIRIARSMEQEGKITIRGQGEEDVFV